MLGGDAHEPHPAIRPELRHGDAAGLNSGHDAVLVAGRDYLIDGIMPADVFSNEA